MEKKGISRKGKVKGQDSSKNKKGELDTSQGEIVEQQGSKSKLLNEANMKDGSSIEEDTSKSRLSTTVAKSSPKTPDKAAEKRSSGESEQDVETEYNLNEKVLAKSVEIPNAADEPATKQLTEVEGKSKVVNQSSSAGFLKWTNKQMAQSKGRKKKERKKGEKQSRQTEVSEYFAVRRSSRRCKSAIEGEKQKELEEALVSGKEDGLEVKEVEGKGRGVFSQHKFTKGQFVCEYAGELIDYQTAKEREKLYEGKTEFGCYMYYFTFKNKKMCVDATKESGRLGRLLNHSKSAANCATRLVNVKDRPYLILETTRDVQAGEELLYDYGERSKDIIQFHQWLKS